jgi:hypothetical protein
MGNDPSIRLLSDLIQLGKISFGEDSQISILSKLSDDLLPLPILAPPNDITDPSLTLPGKTSK